MSLCFDERRTVNMQSDLGLLILCVTFHYEKIFALILAGAVELGTQSISKRRAWISACGNQFSFEIRVKVHVEGKASEAGHSDDSHHRMDPSPIVAGGPALFRQLLRKRLSDN
ncbi:hypothetical protein [Sandarakinorhabdus sp.]|uniref:hypothetical protein n=1 Tax=Sandarakinorhabdus sp. TaxID=1916663 RepID=UPI003F6FA246